MPAEGRVSKFRRSLNEEHCIFGKLFGIITVITVIHRDPELFPARKFVLNTSSFQISTAGSAVYGMRKINQSICDLSRDGKLRRTGA